MPGRVGTCLTRAPTPAATGAAIDVPKDARISVCTPSPKPNKSHSAAKIQRNPSARKKGQRSGYFSLEIQWSIFSGEIATRFRHGVQREMLDPHLYLICQCPLPLFVLCPSFFRTTAGVKRRTKDGFRPMGQKEGGGFI